MQNICNNITGKFTTSHLLTAGFVFLLQTGAFAPRYHLTISHNFIEIWLNRVVGVTGSAKLNLPPACSDVWIINIKCDHDSLHVQVLSVHPTTHT